MTYVLWAVLILATTCNFLMVLGGFVSLVHHRRRGRRGGVSWAEATKLDFLMYPMVGVTLIIDFIAAFLGLLLVAGIIDEPGDQLLAIVLTGFPVLITVWFGGLVLAGWLIGLARSRKVK